MKCPQCGGEGGWAAPITLDMQTPPDPWIVCPCQSARLAAAVGDVAGDVVQPPETVRDDG